MCYTNEKTKDVIAIIATTLCKCDIQNGILDDKKLSEIFDKECARIERLAENVYIQSKTEGEWNSFIQKWILKHFKYLINPLNRSDDFVCPENSDSSDVAEYKLSL